MAKKEKKKRTIPISILQRPNNNKNANNNKNVKSVILDKKVKKKKKIKSTLGPTLAFFDTTIIITSLLKSKKKTLQHCSTTTETDFKEKAKISILCFLYNLQIIMKYMYYR